ncbi:MarR family winged helix-turn-helix transcriptional regulator [Myxococcus sp. SDU36]|uniref:MarR family winged helix-turn-helix transcriptional regulator n=1 Tax=Myxococcus sp. SDU36 TaxID=2831967 RepID=UPI002542E2BF|nr:MarR family winged helix-turn-helix transcriptional regulator [Myxococcus sp. SDU36]WIG97761.1 MarR family winged helix-turn-helix transcriptional regulator [Myxococcus sp. SDU36]
MPDAVDELRRITQRFFRRFGALAAESTPCGKPLSMAHAHALMVLLVQGELTQQALGAELGIDKSNVARLCAKMVRANHLQQRPSERDGRSRLVSLTSRGARLAKEVDGASRARFGALLGGIPEPRRADVIAALQYLVDALKASPAVPFEERPPE